MKQAEQKQLHGPITADSFLRAVPYANRAMEITRRSDGGALAAVPIPRPRFLIPPLSWILPVSTHRRVELEPVGVAVLDLCDGRRTVEDVIEKFASEHGLSFREAQLSITEFLHQLVTRGLVAIVGRNVSAKAS
jgi:hypothetical protein